MQLSIYSEIPANRVPAGYGRQLLEVWHKLKCKSFYILFQKKFVKKQNKTEQTQKEKKIHTQAIWTKFWKPPGYSILLFSLQKNQDITYEGKH